MGSGARFFYGELLSPADTKGACSFLEKAPPFELDPRCCWFVSGEAQGADKAGEERLGDR